MNARPKWYNCRIMEQLSTGQYLYSSLDLLASISCLHKSYLSIKDLNGEIQNSEQSTLVKILRQKNLRYEANYLQKLKDDNLSVIEISTQPSLAERAKLTAEAMSSGADVIYHGTLFNMPWQGIADFLIKCKKKSSLGDYSYEVLSTKLSKTTRPQHIIQLCLYSELVTDIQGTQASNMHLLLADGEKISFRTNDFFFYYSYSKKRFENHIKNINQSKSYPEPCQHCAFCEWKTHCTAQWQQDGHLSQIANIQNKQINKLRDCNIRTIGELAATLPKTEIPGIPQSAFLKLRTQASLQNYKTKTNKAKYEIAQLQSNRGFVLMPPPDQADLFFDIESNSFYPDTSAYLFGIYYILNGKGIFKTFWAHNREQEKKSFEHLIDFFDIHLTKHPNAHIYHYGRCEATALKRISHRYASCEELLANLINTQKFIDLYDIVRDGIYTSEANYSLKSLETFYMDKRTDTITQALDSVAAYNEWRETQDPALLQQIADYNKTDCRSTCLLHDWLIRIKPKEIPWYKKTATSRTDWPLEYENYKAQLKTQQKEAPILHQRLIHLLKSHNQKAKQWNIDKLQSGFEAGLMNDSKCLVALQQTGKTLSKNRHPIYSYRFPSQECALKAGHKLVNIETMTPIGVIYALNKTESIVKIRVHKKEKPLPQQLSIGMSNSIDNSIIQAALYRYANHLINTPEIGHVATELLMHNYPRIKGKIFGENIVDSKNLSDELLKVASNLNHSYLFIQNSPGSGKTHICSQLIVDLIKLGKKIGVSSNSHQTIHYLLKKIEKKAIRKDMRFSGIKKTNASTGNSFYHGDFIQNESNLNEINLNADLFAGTIRTFASPYFDNRLDYLFIDEAEQVDIANVIAISNASKNIILIGDPMQLIRPKSNSSILDLLLGDRMTIPADRGIFLSLSYRLKPEICRFISDVFYEGRLISSENASPRKLHLQGTNLPNDGIAIINTDPQNDSKQSSDEAEIIKNLYRTLLGQTFSDKDNRMRKINENDILVVTPYNFQMNSLRALLPDNARIGTIDKFQGQEAPIVLISMANSKTRQISQKTVDYIYSRSHLNVSLSLAQCLTVIVTNTDMMNTECSTVEQMKLINTYCQLNAIADKPAAKELFTQ